MSIDGAVIQVWVEVSHVSMGRNVVSMVGGGVWVEM